MLHVERNALTSDAIESILSKLPSQRIGVLGDLFLDRYFDLDATLTEPSIETGLDAYQVVRVRSYPGAAGTVVNNLSALGVGAIFPIALIGDDGEGHELRQALQKLPGVSLEGVESWAERRTPTYLKPMLVEPGRVPRELNRLDIHNRQRLSKDAEDRLIQLLEQRSSQLDALVVLDQVSEPDCGMITERVRDHLADFTSRNDGVLILADSRERIGLFRNVSVKPNQHELLHAMPGHSLEDAVRQFYLRNENSVFCTCGERGILLATADLVTADLEIMEVPGYPVTGLVDPVGAGDSTSAGIAAAWAAGASPWQAAAFGNLVASITVQQLGTTGTATPEQVRARWREVGTR
jgi:bifunctional ADP-heptose synthase (sugar kinase/adenylyltransferase)